MGEYERRINAAIGEGRAPTLQDHLDANDADVHARFGALLDRYNAGAQEIISDGIAAQKRIREQWASGELQRRDALRMTDATGRRRTAKKRRRGAPPSATGSANAWRTTKSAPESQGLASDSLLSVGESSLREGWRVQRKRGGEISSRAPFSF